MANQVHKALAAFTIAGFGIVIGSIVLGFAIPAAWQNRVPMAWLLQFTAVGIVQLIGTMTIGTALVCLILAFTNQGNKYSSKERRLLFIAGIVPTATVLLLVLGAIYGLLNTKRWN